MKSLLSATALVLFLATLTACLGGGDSRLPEFPDHPSHAARPGFQWEKVCGAGLQFWAQRDSQTCVTTDGLREEALVAHTDSLHTTYETAIKVFHIENGDIDDVLSQLDGPKDWNAEKACKFQRAECERKGVKRYVLVARDKEGTCHGWGADNNVERYFEIHDSHRDKAVFVNLAKGERPLFDPESIVLTDEPSVAVKGELSIAKDRCTFVACNDTLKFWVKDLTGRMLADYDNATQGTRDGYPTYAELQVRSMGPTTESFAHGCSGVYEVTGVATIQTVQLTASKNYETRKLAADSLRALTVSATVDIIFTPTPGEKGIEVSAPDNVLPYVETYLDAYGRLTINMKRFPQIDADGPFNIELKAPPTATFHNRGQGTLILKNGVDSDGDVRITANGPLMCGAINCRNLTIAANGERSLYVDQLITCQQLRVEAKDNTTVSLTGGISCERFSVAAAENGSANVQGLNSATVEVSTDGTGYVRLTGTCQQAELRIPSSGTIKASQLKAATVRAEVGGTGNVYCLATNRLTAEVGADGHVHYVGRPRIVCPPSSKEQVVPMTKE